MAFSLRSAGPLYRNQSTGPLKQHRFQFTPILPAETQTNNSDGHDKKFFKPKAPESRNIVEKLEFFLQYSRQSNGDSTVILVSFGIALFVILVILAIIWQTSIDNEYDDAIKAFEADPSNEQKREAMIEAAKEKGRTNRGSGRYALEVMSLIENARDEAERKQKPKTDIVAELNSLSSLRDRGLLTDAEFEQAKAKLLN